MTNSPERGCGVCQGKDAPGTGSSMIPKDSYTQLVEYDVTAPSRHVSVVLKQAVLAMGMASDYPGRVATTGSEQSLLRLLATKIRPPTTNPMRSPLFRRHHVMCTCTIVCQLKGGTVRPLDFHH
jgi:hypothetical protein